MNGMPIDIEVKDLDDERRWPLAQAILESIEEGASRHCLSIENRPGTAWRMVELTKVQHHGLDLTIRFTETEVVDCSY